MRKILFTLILCLGSAAVFAQRSPHALGLRFGGSTMDIEYRYHFDSENFINVDVGLFQIDKGFSASAIYNWNLKQWSDWTPRLGTWKLWSGVGGAFGHTTWDKYDGMFVGVVGNLGFGFTLNTSPWTFAVDYRPMVAVALGDESGILSPGFWNFGISIVHRF